jgi:hypothetical protein
MTWKEHLLAQGYTNEEISNMEKTFGGDKMAKAFEAPIAAQVAAEANAKKYKEDLEAFENRYQTEILPEISKTYKDAINYRTEAEGLKARLAAAKEYGFLSEDAAGDAAAEAAKKAAAAKANANPVAGSPALDPRYVEASAFSTAVDSIPDMLGRLSKMSNEHLHLFGSPLLDVDELVAASKATKGKKSVYDLWDEKYKVSAKRTEVAAAAKAASDKKIGEEAVQKYLSENGMPFTRPAVPSIATRFTNVGKDEARQPWKGARDRKEERHGAMMNAWAKGKAGTVNSAA